MKKSTLGKIYLLIACVLWGSGFTGAKVAVENIPPSLLLTMRFAIGAVVLGAIFHKKLAKVTWKQVGRVSVIGIFLAAACIAQTVGLTDTTPGKNAFLTAVYCILTPFCVWALSRKRPPAKTFLAAIVCLAGIGLVSLDGDLSIRFGDWMTLISGAIFAVQIVSIEYLGNDVDGGVLSAIQFASSAIVCLLYHLLFESSMSLSTLDASTWWMVLYLGLFPTSIGYTLQILGQKQVPANVSSLIMSTESVFGVLISVLFYGEQITLRVAAGFVVIFLAIMISETTVLDRLPGKGKMLEK